MRRIIVLQKVDLDTCLTAVLLGVTSDEEVRVSNGPASPDELIDPMVLCIEAGGDGEILRNNFDHHLPGEYLPPACRQALTCTVNPSTYLLRLVDYVCLVDEASDELPFIPPPSLSSLFSGLLLHENEPLCQFRQGLKLLHTLMKSQLDPFAPLPPLPEWQAYLAAKKMNSRHLSVHLESAVCFTSQAGLKIGYLPGTTGFSTPIGGTRALYARGCEIAVLYSSDWGAPPVRKFTIASKDLQISPLIKRLNALEPGWGGRDTIIGSPRCGTLLPESVVLDLLKTTL